MYLYLYQSVLNFFKESNKVYQKSSVLTDAELINIRTF